jgi:hypothetical protein
MSCLSGHIFNQDISQARPKFHLAPPKPQPSALPGQVGLCPVGGMVKTQHSVILSPLILPRFMVGWRSRWNQAESVLGSGER